MNDQHFTDGEEVDLCRLLFNDETRLKELRSIRDKMDPANWETVWEYTMTILGYKDRSTFGRTREKIIENAREHLTNCQACLKKYRATVHRLAYQAINLEVGQLAKKDSFEAAFYERIRKIDKLDLLK